MDFGEIINEFEKAEITIRRDEPMSAHTSFRIGGPFSAMVFPKSEKELELAVYILKNYGQKPLLFGNGTNLLVTDDRIERIAIKTHDGVSAGTYAGEGTIVAGSGRLLSKLAVFAKERGLTGLEFAHGIPGTLGGAICMNAGAYGGEMKDVVKKVTYLDENLTRCEATAEELDFSYRHSLFSEKNCVILEAEVELQVGDKDEIEAKMNEFISKRRNSQPLNLPSAGSTFKRPKEGYAAALIEEAGLKGFTIGGAAVSEKHAGFVVNQSDATFGNVMSVIEHVQETVYKKFGILLEPEVKIINS